MITIKKALLHGLAIAAIAIVPFTGIAEGTMPTDSSYPSVSPGTTPGNPTNPTYRSDGSYQRNDGSYQNRSDNPTMQHSPGSLQSPGMQNRSMQNPGLQSRPPMSPPTDLDTSAVDVGFYYGSPYYYRPNYYRPYYYNYYYPYYRPYYYYSW